MDFRVAAGCYCRWAKYSVAAIATSLKDPQYSQLYQRSTRQGTQKIDVRERNFQISPRQLSMLPREAFGACALAFGNGVDDAVVMLLTDDEKLGCFRPLRTK